MDIPSFVLQLDDSARKLGIVERACLQAGATRDQIWQTKDPDEALAIIEDLRVGLLAVITDNHIEGHGLVGLNVAERAVDRLGANRVLGYSTHFATLPQGVQLHQAVSGGKDIKVIQRWLEERRIFLSKAA